MTQLIELYSIEYCLDRLYKKTQSDVPKHQKISVKKPNIIIMNKKTCILNFEELCNSINRKKEAVKSFIDSCLHTPSSICGKSNEVLEIDNMYTKHQILDVIEKYVQAYVICSTCKSRDTKLEKEERILYLKCNACNCKKSVG